LIFLFVSHNGVTTCKICKAICKICRLIYINFNSLGNQIYNQNVKYTEYADYAEYEGYALKRATRKVKIKLQKIMQYTLKRNIYAEYEEYAKNYSIKYADE
jgi:hypothetical protein